MPYTDTTIKSYEKVWKDLLILKVKILYDLSVEKKLDFEQLILDELPEANSFKKFWEKDYN